MVQKPAGPLWRLKYQLHQFSVVITDTRIKMLLGGKDATTRVYTHTRKNRFMYVCMHKYAHTHTL